MSLFHKLVYQFTNIKKYLSTGIIHHVHFYKEQGNKNIAITRNLIPPNLSSTLPLKKEKTCPDFSRISRDFNH